MEVQESEFEEKMMDYLYEELSPVERSQFEAALQTDEELRKQYQSLLQVRQIIQRELPNPIVPKHVVKGVQQQLKLRRSWHDIFHSNAMWRPVLAMAATFILVFGLTYQWRRHESKLEIVNKKTASSASMQVASQKSLEELKFSDVLPVHKNLQKTIYRPVWQRSPSLGGGMVTLASYGTPQYISPVVPPEQVEIHNMDQEAEQDVAQFAHQQALRFRVMGDFREAAGALAKVIREYPDYPGKFEALAQRIDCLFRSGQVETAKRELIWLGAFAPDLAYLVADRWAQ